MKTPKELIPAPEMTVPQYQAWYRLLQRDPRINDVTLPYEVAPGDSVKMKFTQWNDIFYILIIPEDTNWHNFDDLRVQWEKDAKIST